MKAPTTRLQIPKKPQISSSNTLGGRPAFGTWSLGFGIYLEFGTWNLEVCLTTDHRLLTTNNPPDP